ncbi:MAG: hypothetical protein HFH46_01130 [Bacilli bacterium]|nr:hypothetical protein [Bacilli bacterium]
MREGIGETFTYNMIIVFIVIVFGILSATISYYKAYKVNNRILDSIDKYEGYNAASQADIQNTLKNIGYTVNGEGAKCPNRSKGTLEPQDGTYLYCVYYFENDRSSVDKRTNKEHEPIYYNYSVASYIYIELPIVGAFKIPVYTKGERIYNFSHRPSGGASA